MDEFHFAQHFSPSSPSAIYKIRVYAVTRVHASIHSSIISIAYNSFVCVEFLFFLLVLLQFTICANHTPSYIYATCIQNTLQTFLSHLLLFFTPFFPSTFPFLTSLSLVQMNFSNVFMYVSECECFVSGCCCCMFFFFVEIFFLLFSHLFFNISICDSSILVMTCSHFALISIWSLDVGWFDGPTADVQRLMDALDRCQCHGNISDTITCAAFQPYSTNRLGSLNVSTSFHALQSTENWKFEFKNWKED